MFITAAILYEAMRKKTEGLRYEAGKTNPSIRCFIPGERGAEHTEADVCLVKNGSLFFEKSGTPFIRWQGEETARPTDQLLLKMATEARDELLEWDARMCDDILRRAPVKDILSRGKLFLSGYYTLVNREMIVLYSSPVKEKPHFPVFRTGERLSDEIINELMMQKEFHDAANFETSFYYREAYSDVISLCHNIYINGQYFARLLLILPEGREKLSEGEEELFAHFAERIEQMYQTRAGFFNPLNGMDQIHRICQSAIAGEPADPLSTGYTLNQIQWKSNHLYVVCEFRFFSGSDWNAQLETALPYLVNALEQEWVCCRAFVLENVVLCVVNLSAFSVIHGNTGRFDSSRLLKEFCREIGVFVREHACQAGISSVCSSFSKLKEAAQQAHTALRIGPGQNPSYWYHLFDDCRLNYMLGVLRDYALPSMQEHPDLIVLREYDRLHGTALYDTLEAYIECQLNMQAAADHLFIHRTTFCRRMDRIRELLGKDLSVSRTRLELELALHMAKM